MPIQIVEPTRLFLTWRNALVQPDIRYVIGSIDLDISLNDWVFNYLMDTDDYKHAVSQKFDGYPAFTTLKSRHTGNIIESFLHRIFPRSGKSYEDYLHKHNLSIDTPLSDISLLAYTGAKLRLDTFELCADFMWNEKNRMIERG